MKRIALCILCVILIVSSVLSSCGTGNLPITDFSKIEDSFWIAEETYRDTQHYKMFIILNGIQLVMYDFSRSTGKDLSDMFADMLSSVKKKKPDMQFDDVASFITADVAIDGLEVSTYYITTNAEEGRISAGNLEFNYQSNDTFKCHGDTYYRHDTLSVLENAFNIAKNRISSSGKEAFLSKYKDALTNKEVQYDPIGNLNKPFIITGKASLDDYYNFEYSDFNAVYFCVEITPQGSGYTDRWYVYAERSKFSELYNALLNGEKTLTLICRTQFYNASQHRMATLADAYIN